ncbi:MAG TPA: isocitrate lyase/phosphoenolpyruvate mutase family protein [Acidimicrobiales bacterium]|jgi:2-methylisocitrate lyase-like PEP mutase family enzyme|nr:isocitrate lyase/phosphoenolpyruvate mutase family protein [Acidimicrobiales bacterium]
MDHTATRAQFRRLHESGTFTMPNPHDVGSCRLLTELGFAALATTSGGFAYSLGRLDMTVGRDALVAHVATLAAATHLPINVDAENCFPDAPGGIRATIELLAAAGASGCSIEDYNPATTSILDRDEAVRSVAVAAAAAKDTGVVLTARAENHLRGVADLDDTIARLCAYRDAGADVLYAPVLPDLAAIARAVDETAMPVNVLLRPGGPTVAELAALGVRRLSVGGTLASVAYGALYRSAARLRDEGVLDVGAGGLAYDVVVRAFSGEVPS